MYLKKTKIVATIGPATESEEMLEKLINHGVNVCRLNFSHGDFEEHGRRIERIRKVSKKQDLPVAILQDLAGPKIRIGDFYQERVILKEGSKFVLTTEKIVGDEKRASINYEKLPKEVKKGQIIFLDDGKKKLIVEKVSGNEIFCKILVGGETKGRRGVNVPGAYLSISSITEKDRKDLAFGLKQGVDYVALSFVRRPEDVKELRKILAKNKTAGVKIISKIETQEAVDNLDAILAETDGVMVARGDLAIEVPAEQVPFIQKTLIQKCNKMGKPVITATQMLESMIKAPVPTRAEVNDVANAIYDGTDAVMLSEETTLGDHPLKAVEVMYRVSVQTEKHLPHDILLERGRSCNMEIGDSLSHAAIHVLNDVCASAIAVYTTSGNTARLLSRHRPAKPLLVLTPDEKVYNQMALNFSCYGILTKEMKSLKDFGDDAREILKKKNLVKKGETILLITGLPLGQTYGSTNMMLVEKV